LVAARTKEGKAFPASGPDNRSRKRKPLLFLLAEKSAGSGSRAQERPTIQKAMKPLVEKEIQPL